MESSSVESYGFFSPSCGCCLGQFTVADLAVQQDILEFISFITDRLGPTFISCSWCTRFQHTTKVSHPILDSEKGARHSPILLRFINYMDLQCSLADLIMHWHDSSGLCRAGDQASSCIILMIDRHIETQNRKCPQKITLPTDFISFPFFADDMMERSHIFPSEWQQSPFIWVPARTVDTIALL